MVRRLVSEVELFFCNDGEAIKKEFVCDEDPDCFDGTDELQNCPDGLQFSCFPISTSTSYLSFLKVFFKIWQESYRNLKYLTGTFKILSNS